MEQRALITGIGTVNPLGLDAPSTWEAMLAGRSGIETIAAFDPSDHPVRIAGEVRGFDPEQVASRKDARRMDRGVLFAVAAADEAVADSGIDKLDPERTGVVVGSAIGGIATKLGVVGLNFAVVSACATGSHAIGEAAELIKQGKADVILAGGTEACITPLVLAGFCQMQALAPGNDDPPAASRPFDRGRAGFVIAEGAAVVLLESEEHARARGAKVYAEVAGYGASNDAYHVATPHPESRGVIHMFNDALRSAKVRPEEVGYVNAHGTGTPLGDPAETQAIRQAFGAHADKLAVSSTKSMTGHLFGAAGALEAIASALALRDQVLPPTINLEDPDPACDLDYVPLKSREARFDVAISNSMGLGGHNGAVVLRRASS